MIAIPAAFLFGAIFLLAMKNSKGGLIAKGGALLFGFSLYATEFGPQLRSLVGELSSTLRAADAGGSWALSFGFVVLFAVLWYLCKWANAPIRVTLIVIAFFGFYLYPTSAGPFIRDGVGGTTTVVNDIAPS